MDEKRPWTCSEAGRKGGKAVVERYGREHYERMGKKGGTTTRDRHGEEHYAEIGSKGGTECAARNSVEYYQRIGKLGAAMVKELVAKGLQAEERER